MTQMNQAMAALKLSLAEMRARDDRLKAMIRQFETQLKRIPRQAMYGRAPLNLALGSMAEIEERLRHSQTQRRHLLNIMEQARMELEALVLVQRIESAREQACSVEEADKRRYGRGYPGPDYSLGGVHRPIQQAGGTGHHHRLQPSGGVMPFIRRDGTVGAGLLALLS